MISSHRVSTVSVNTARRCFGTKTKGACRVWMTLRPLRISGSGSQRGDTDSCYLSDVTVAGVKIVVQVKLLPTAAQAVALAATLRTVNVEANRVSAVAFDHGVTGKQA